MDRRILKPAVLAAWCSLAPVGAQPSDGPAFDRARDTFGELVKRPAGSEVVMTLAWGEHAMMTNIQRQTGFIRRVATEAERRIAEQNAAAYYAQLSKSQKAEIKKKKRYWAVPITKAKPPSKQGQKTPKEEAPKADDIMIYDPLSGSTVNKYVYTLESIPSPETPMSVDGYEPLLYVGR
jgi:hypothetical protein